VTERLIQVIDGDVDTSSLTRSMYSSDASNSRVVPDIVVLPRHTNDVTAALEVARQYSLAVTARGGGTSIAGNAVGPGLVLDFSRYMNKILDIDLDTQTVTVQPGVVLSDLQQVLAPYVLRFGPDPSSANRCTIGGMIGNNACGPHALSYGRTADNVVSMQLLTGTGEILCADSDAKSFNAVNGLEELVMGELALLRTEFGRFDRQISGYSLEHLLQKTSGTLPPPWPGPRAASALF